MRRFFTEPSNINGDTAVILEDAAHITRVLRLKPGDRVLLFDGTGYEYTAALTALDAKECTAHIIEKRFSLQEPKFKITIFQGIPKSGKMESIIQKSVELGVYAIVPTAMQRCVAKLDNEKKELEKQKRWNKVSKEAAKQCGRGLVPHVAKSMSFKEALGALRGFDLALMPYEELGHSGDRSLKRVLQAVSPVHVGVLIGPEGGFSDEEAALAKEAGLCMIGLGRRILRTETVASAIISMMMYEYDEI